MSADLRSQVLQAVDLVELISQTVALKRRGRDFVGLCPFHQEKTPSFHVNPSKQSFYCFGCKAGGTAFDFVMRRDRVEFKEALEILAGMAGIEIPKSGGSRQNAGERQALIDANSAACRFFENQLWNPELGLAAREYLKKRGFTEETLRRFQVGLALDSWDSLLKGPVGRKFGPQTLALAGLVKARERGDGHYDTFRNRIMFPIRSEGGQIIAFGGRVMPGSEDPAKYLNSPETPLFSKSRSIFGLDFARQRIVETRTVAVCEGYTDTIMAHQFGAANVVSALGTALTEHHLTILRRFADRIVLLFDADAAGNAAADRVVQLFLTQPVEIAVAGIPDGMDPDEYLLKFGRDEFDRLLSGAQDALTYSWKQLSRQFVSKEGDLTGQQKAVQQYLDLLASARGSGPVDALRWGAALSRVSRLTEIPTEELHQRFKAQKAPVSRGPVPAAAPVAPRRPAGPRSARERAERQILGVLLTEPHNWQNVQLAVCVEDFADPGLKRLAQALWTYQRDEGEPVFNELLAVLPDAELKALAIELTEEVEELGDLSVTLREGLACLAEEKAQSSSARTADEADELEGLKRAQDRARRPDLRRPGPLA